MKKNKFIYILIFMSPFVLIFLTLFNGRYPIPLKEIPGILAYPFAASSSFNDTYATIIWNIRMPRALLSALAGASLAVSGAAFQGLFHNPLVNSGMLGVSSGSGFGAALAILLFARSSPFVYIFALMFGGIAVFLSYTIGRIYNTTPTIMLVLGGTVVSSIFSALISLVKYMADPLNELPAITFWLMGSFASASAQDILIGAPPMIFGIAGLILMRWRINVLSMGDREAHTLGISSSINKLAAIIFATLSTAGAVCVSGNIGWVGLIIPHVGRMIVGNDNNSLIPVSCALGASFLIIIDNISRTLISGEIPIGILTSLVGGPFFIYLLKKTKGGSW
ncbi:iron ABC transporter permease [Sedimentibacter sp. B4]|uniref:FecCD family ABC transporter permease n=1 Tax=Sedimentibacter sp. B4 TaxID=304766 RepID=UPI00031C2ED8|nr:iron ABC transporter permease [Sedimentibacter sp. B4]